MATPGNTVDIRSRIRGILADARRENPLDDAQACVSYLAAIDQLLSAANQNNLHVVNASDLGMLIMHIRQELDDCLQALAYEDPAGPHLRTV